MRGIWLNYKLKIYLSNLTVLESNRNGLFTAVEDINLSINEGEFVCFVGPSGCGKTTLLNILAGLDYPTRGEIILNGKPINKPGSDRIMVFQENALFPWLKVIDNVEFGLKVAGVRKEKRREIAIHYLDTMQLTKFADSVHISVVRWHETTRGNRKSIGNRS